jgi:hypothetical protein
MVTFQKLGKNMAQRGILPETAPIPKLTRTEWVVRPDTPVASQQGGVRELLGDAGHVNLEGSILQDPSVSAWPKEPGHACLCAVRHRA